MDVRVRGGQLAVHAGGAGGGGGRHADERGPVQAGMQAGGRATDHEPRKEILSNQSFLNCPVAGQFQTKQGGILKYRDFETNKD